MLLSSAVFALSSVFIKYAATVGNPPIALITFVRFTLGFLTAFAVIRMRRISLRPNTIRPIVFRALFNGTAVVFFFFAIANTSITKANLLNMLYPVFVFVIAPFIADEHSPPYYYLFLLLALIGGWLVIAPDGAMLSLNGLNIGDLAAFISAILAGFGITYLRIARKTENTFVILFYAMGAGMLVNTIVLLFSFSWPGMASFAFLIAAGLCAVSGQILITLGYRYINAAPGALISVSRILFAAAFGVFLFGEQLGIPLIIGGILILIALAGVSGILERLRIPAKYKPH
jgi:drug/metabolite transporter (DMT)-like permease